MSNNLVVVITGASRGIGRGIARIFGAAGATVYVTGRTRASGGPVRPNEMPLPGTIDGAAAEVSQLGGTGIAVECDLASDGQIKSLFAQVARDSGHVDILVNNAAFLHNAMGTPGPFWTRPPEMADILDVGLRCHFVATYYAAPLMIDSGKGLVVNMSFFGDAGMHEPAYYAAKAGLDKLADCFAKDFKPHGVAAVSLWPGVVATERVVQIAEQLPSLKAQLSAFETQEFCGLVIKALYEDPLLMSLSGKTLIAAELAARYGIRDTNGNRPISHRGTYGVPHKVFDVA